MNTPQLNLEQLNPEPENGSLMPTRSEVGGVEGPIASSLQARAPLKCMLYGGLYTLTLKHIIS